MVNMALIGILYMNHQVDDHISNIELCRSFSNITQNPCWEYLLIHNSQRLEKFQDEGICQFVGFSNCDLSQGLGLATPATVHIIWRFTGKFLQPLHCLQLRAGILRQTRDRTVKNWKYTP